VYFFPNRQKVNGLTSWCKECVREASRNRARVTADKHRECAKKWRIANPEKHREKNRLWRKDNTDKTAEWNRKYRESNRDKVRLGKRKYKHHRRALIRGGEGSRVPFDEQAQLKRQKGKCYYCQCKLEKYHVDHVIPLSRGGSDHPDNKVLACPSCNQRKGAKLPHEFVKGGRLL
jgi:5-methylcytosine-specific restriction endonuclease McrA